MLNSQPLGFYDPSDLTQDARRHGVQVLPVDVNQSEWDHCLVDTPHAATHDMDGNCIQEDELTANRVDAPTSAGQINIIPNTQEPMPQAAVRLGLRLVAKLSVSGANRLLKARESGPFTSAADLVRRTGINQTDQQALAIAGALSNISGDRHQAQWDLLGVELLPELLQERC